MEEGSLQRFLARGGLGGRDQFGGIGVILLDLVVVVPVRPDVLLPEVLELLRDLLRGDFLDPQDADTRQDDADDVHEGQDKTDATEEEGFKGKVVVDIAGHIGVSDDFMVVIDGMPGLPRLVSEGSHDGRESPEYATVDRWREE